MMANGVSRPRWSALRRIRVAPLVGLVLLGGVVLVGVRDGLAVRAGIATVETLTGEVALSAAVDRRAAYADADGRWAAAGVGELVRLAIDDDQDHPGAVAVHTSTDIGLPTLALIHESATWTHRATAAARRSAAGSVGVAPRHVAPDAGVLSAVATAVWEIPVEISPAERDALAGAPLPVTALLERLAPADAVEPWGDRPVGVSVLVAAAADALPEGPARAALARLAGVLAETSVQIRPADLVDLGPASTRPGLRSGLSGFDLSADRFLTMLLGRTAAGRTIEIPLPDRDAERMAPVATVTLAKGGTPPLLFSPLPAILALPAASVTVEVTVPSGGKSAFPHVRVPLTLEMTAGRLTLGAPACADAKAVPRVGVEARTGRLTYRFAEAGAAEGDRPPRIVEGSGFQAFVLGRRDLHDPEPTRADLSPATGRGRFTTGAVVGLRAAVEALVVNADVRIAFDDGTTDAKTAAPLRREIADLVGDARRSLADHLAAVAAALDLPVDGIALGLSDVRCDLAETL